MILWVILAIMTVIAVMVVLVPLSRRRDDTELMDVSEIAVYKDQLNELAHDIERGVLAQPEAEAARTEIARRLLKAADNQGVQTASVEKSNKVLRKVTAGFALICIPGFSLAFYLIAGTPQLPAQPFAQRASIPASKSPRSEESTKILIARAEEHLAKNPDDIRGWKILAPIYTRLRRFSDASFALKRVMELSGGNPQATAEYGESLIVGNRGEVGPKALEVFQKLLKTNPKMPRPLHYIALADAQAGRLKLAATKWRTLLASNPQITPWRADVEQLAARAEGKEPPKSPASSNQSETLGQVDAPKDSQLPTLTKEQMDAGKSMEASARQKMIASMVKRLSDRLAANGGSVAEWIKLARTQMVLGKNDAAKAALASAQAAYADSPESLQQLKNAHKTLGIDP